MTAKYPPVPFPDVPSARELRELCLGFEGAYEDYPWGDIVYKVGTKVFCFLGASEGVTGITVKATPDDAVVLTQRPGVARARYIGQHGWITVRIADDDMLAFARDLIADSYAHIAPKKRRWART